MKERERTGDDGSDRSVCLVVVVVVKEEWIDKLTSVIEREGTVDNRRRRRFEEKQ